MKHSGDKKRLLSHPGAFSIGRRNSTVYGTKKLHIRFPILVHAVCAEDSVRKGALRAANTINAHEKDPH
eukprot:1876249-Amphidinium_carterae.2